MSRSSAWLLNYLCIALFTPWPYLWLGQGDQLNLVRSAIAALLVGMLIHHRRSGGYICEGTDGGGSEAA
jgi:hypothetical protein